MTRHLASRLTVLVMLAVITAVSGVAMTPTSATAAEDAVLSVSGSPFDPDGDGRREAVHIRLQVGEPATVGLHIRDFDGRLRATISRGAAVSQGTSSWRWRGRDDAGRRVPYGPYLLTATVRTASGATIERRAWLTRARRVPYPTRPGAVLVAIDAGHGGADAGAVWRGLAEDEVNLDIALRLEAMLEGAGVGVVMTRRSDDNVSPVGKDLNFDGRYSRLDELIARNDVANQARADVHLALHNNATACHCTRGTEMYTHDGRGWSPEGRKLARFLLDAHLWHLDRRPGYRPRDRGVHFHPFKALKPYHPRAMPRPSLQPSVLGESLFIDWPSEQRILASRAGRTSLAAAYFDGIARYLAWRPYGLRYQVLESPGPVTVGGTSAVTLRLTNTGRRTSSDWKLVARVVTKVPRYDGRPMRGTIVAKAAIPDGLRPGETADVRLTGVPMPADVGAWLLKLDVRLPGGDSLSRHGVVGPQLRVDTVEPADR